MIRLERDTDGRPRGLYINRAPSQMQRANPNSIRPGDSGPDAFRLTD